MGKYSEFPFCKRLRRLMLSANAVQGLSDGQIAAGIGLSPARISDYKRGRNLPSLFMLENIADYFGVSTDYLLGREGYELEEKK